MPQTKNRLEAFGALRALCCLSVILLHTHVTTYTAYLGVTAFFIMSGFLLVYNYYDRTELDGAGLSLCFRFAHGKVKKLYPLHLLTMGSMPTRSSPDLQSRHCSFSRHLSQMFS